MLRCWEPAECGGTALRGFTAFESPPPLEPCVRGYVFRARPLWETGVVPLRISAGRRPLRPQTALHCGGPQGRAAVCALESSRLRRMKATHPSCGIVRTAVSLGSPEGGTTLHRQYVYLFVWLRHCRRLRGKPSFEIPARHPEDLQRPLAGAPRTGPELPGDPAQSPPGTRGEPDPSSQRAQIRAPGELKRWPPTTVSPPCYGTIGDWSAGTGRLIRARICQARGGRGGPLNQQTVNHNTPGGPLAPGGRRISLVQKEVLKVGLHQQIALC